MVEPLIKFQTSNRYKINIIRTIAKYKNVSQHKMKVLNSNLKSKCFGDAPTRSLDEKVYNSGIMNIINE